MITAVTHVTILVHSINDALTFYVDKLGLMVHTDTDLGEMRWLTLCVKGRKDFEIVLFEVSTPEDAALVGKQSGSCIFLCLSSSDVEQDVKDMKQRGVEFAGAIEEHSWGKAVTIKDLYGNMIYLVEPPK